MKVDPQTDIVSEQESQLTSKSSDFSLHEIIHDIEVFFCSFRYSFLYHQ